MVTEVSPEQFEKAYLQIEATEFGMVTEVSPEWLAKAPSPMEVTEYVVPSNAIVSGIITPPL